ncbi:MAG TPA: dTDP-4-dehydrorhamnose 3,5-epimerase family protein [Bdellovibrionota bacterium]|jgi:dTDP-4-dehydrorhamnose 3,5-epimerase
MANTVQIQGVQLISKRKIIDDRGAIFHMLRKDDPEFQAFGEIYFSKIHPGVVKAWHHHSRMALNYLVVVGSIQLGLWDGRKDSATYGKSQTIFLDEQTSQLAIVPPGVWNGFKGLGSGSSIVANCATEPHDPQEITRKPWDDKDFHYDWSTKNG